MIHPDKEHVQIQMCCSLVGKRLPQVMANCLNAQKTWPRAAVSNARSFLNFGAACHKFYLQTFILQMGC